MSSYLFTSESVTEGHPDKLADQISDAILDAYLASDKKARVALETLLTGKMAILAGEVSSDAYVDVVKVAREVIQEVGYDRQGDSFRANKVSFLVDIGRQSPDIALGVDEYDGHEQGAGDQGLMFGYACDETPDLMPYPLWLAHRLVQRQAELRKSGALPWLRPDAKSQVTVAYEGQKMVGVETVIISTQIARGLDPAWVAQEVAREIVDPLVPRALRTPTFRLWVNPAGPFEIGGPNGDTGLTGRKIIVDTYGGSCPHGGGAFSGKDPTKVDRSAAYMARYIAKNLVAAGMARRCLVQLAYAIGVAEPVSLLVDTYGTGTVSDEKLEDMVRCSFKLTPRGIIESLDLRRPIYRKTAAYGHFGRAEPEFTWERVDQAEKLAAYKG